ncbi:farnesoate epoxidase [Folsomia candida]|uniref:Farnesoate epoxidase n=1 Tax=Folsomia candida TaxID=158441 RepID=A0A226DJU3_FOLCA|nr:farnesoate epoxidase [Folsomia candida]OXA45390.1 Farnesoate epoxidase [Folsomia candida]
MFFYYALAITALLILYYLLLKDDRDSKEPPGPKPVPIIGNLVDLLMASGNMTLALGNLAEKYGEIYSLKMGSKKTVILTSKDAMQTILSNEATFARDFTGMWTDRSFHKNLGIAFSEGEVWEKLRPWTFKMLKDFGFGKSSDMERFIQVASQRLFATIDDKIGPEKKSCDIDIELLYNQPILSIMWQMIVGDLSPEDEPSLKILSEKGDAFVRVSIFGAGIVIAFPFLRFVFPNALGYNVQMDFFQACNTIAQNLFKEMEEKMRKSPLSTPTNLLKAFVQNCTKDPKIFNCDNFLLTFQDILLTSTETSNTFMEILILYLITYPDVQEKVYAEILKVSPDERDLSFSDRKKMPYTQAFFLEAHRKGQPFQNLVPRRALSDITYKDYIIKKDTIIMSDTRLYYENKEDWPDPEVFRPERFLDEAGQVVNAGKIISFSFGKRNCPGELQANIVTFLGITALLQRYKLSVPRGQCMPRLDMRPGLTSKPYPFQATFAKRQ